MDGAGSSNTEGAARGARSLLDELLILLAFLLLFLLFNVCLYFGFWGGALLLLIGGVVAVFLLLREDHRDWLVARAAILITLPILSLIHI